MTEEERRIWGEQRAIKGCLLHEICDDAPSTLAARITDNSRRITQLEADLARAEMMVAGLSAESEDAMMREGDLS